MEQFFQRDADFERLYNCSFYNVSAISMEERANAPLGAVIMAISTIEMVCICIAQTILAFLN